MLQKKLAKGPLRRLRLTYCGAAFLAFFAGIAIYLFFRNHDIALFQFLPTPSFLGSLRIPVRTDNILVSMFIFNLPHGLWCLAGLLVIRAVWLTNTKWRAIYAGLFVLIAFVMEISQLFGVIPGTFDVFDMAFVAIFCFAESLIFNGFVKGELCNE